MKKSVSIVLIIILAALAAFYTFFRKNSTLWLSDTKFSVNQAKSVTQIIISNTEKNLVFTKIQNTWRVDDIEARQELVDFLLKISEQIEISAPVSQTQADSILTRIKQGTQISFYVGRRMETTISFCKLDDEIYATHNKSKTPYIIDVKGYPEIDLAKIFNPEKGQWIKNNLFNANFNDVEYLQLSFPELRERDFTIEKQADGKYTISGSYVKSELEVNDKNTLNEFMRFFSDILYYPVLGDKILIEKSLTERTPFFHLVLKDKMGILADIQAYKKLDTISGKEDPFEFYAISTKTGLILLKYNDFDPILAGKDYFLKK